MVMRVLHQSYLTGCPIAFEDGKDLSGIPKFTTEGLDSRQDQVISPTTPANNTHMHVLDMLNGRGAWLYRYERPQLTQSASEPAIISDQAPEATSLGVTGLSGALDLAALLFPVACSDTTTLLYLLRKQQKHLLNHKPLAFRSCICSHTFSNTHAHTRTYIHPHTHRRVSLDSFNSRSPALRALFTARQIISRSTCPLYHLRPNKISTPP